MIMTDLKLSNIMLRIDDESVLQDYEQAEVREPSTRKVIDKERTIYTSRNFRRPEANAYGPPVLCDFGEARIGTPQPYTEIQPECYKAPEILMQFEWGHAVDIWNAGCLVGCVSSVLIALQGRLTGIRCGRCWRSNICSRVQILKGSTIIAII